MKLNWENLKSKKTKKSIPSGIPKKLPTILKAQRAQDKASSVGFDWNSINSVKSKLEEEMKS